MTAGCGPAVCAQREKEGEEIVSGEIQMTAQPVTGGEGLQRKVTHHLVPETARMGPLLTVIGTSGLGEGGGKSEKVGVKCSVLCVVFGRYGDDYRGGHEGRGRRGYGSGGWNER